MAKNILSGSLMRPVMANDFIPAGTLLRIRGPAFNRFEFDRPPWFLCGGDVVMVHQDCVTGLDIHISMFTARGSVLMRCPDDLLWFEFP